MVAVTKYMSLQFWVVVCFLYFIFYRLRLTDLIQSHLQIRDVTMAGYLFRNLEIILRTFIRGFVVQLVVLLYTAIQSNLKYL